MNPQISKAWLKIHEIKQKMLFQGLDYYEARKLAEPHLELINAKGREISKRYKKAYNPLTFTKAMR